jgi:predicted dehydrogenase
MAPGLEEARAMLLACRENGVKLFIHENFRWQAPVRALKQSLDSGIIGKPFKARVTFCSGFPVFENQPFLKELDHFIITDIGSHVLDVSRYLFGEARRLFCLTGRVNPEIKGEDVANVLMEMQNGTQCFVEMSYASILSKESFPQTLVLIEGERGSLHLTHDFELVTTTRGGSNAVVIKPQLYSWVDPEYAVVHSSIVDCNRDILRGLLGGQAETTGDDNFKTVQLVWAAYQSAETGKPFYL